MKQETKTGYDAFKSLVESNREAAQARQETTHNKEGLHTQGEWYVNNSHDDNGEMIIKTNPEYGDQKYFSLGIKGEYNFVGFFYPNSKQSDTEMIANAKIICQAVNERKALLDACDKLLVELSPSFNFDFRNAPQCIQDFQFAINNAKNI